ncbi:MAG: glycine cleavage system protein GcvH [Elusimicrobia bacterium]|jgi:glycine cleavage system H protein|nr:glycine cleavage system protein GcvH [Elusimicrobiota bacterium]MBQ4178377.1 glycine cleavage system protein GcvH [Elusimicrobiota bacterium]
MNTPNNLCYAKTHEWARKEGNKVYVGITDHAQHEITDIVHVELPEVGKKFDKEQPCAVVESVKSAFDIYCPVSGTVVEVNEELLSAPELINQDPYGKGYFFVLEVSNEEDFKDLMNAEQYTKSIEG